MILCAYLHIPLPLPPTLSMSTTKKRPPADTEQRPLEERLRQKISDVRDAALELQLLSFEAGALLQTEDTKTLRLAAAQIQTSTRRMQRRHGAHEWLSAEIWEHICGFLSQRALLRLSRVCKGLCIIARRNVYVCKPDSLDRVSTLTENFPRLNTIVLPRNVDFAAAALPQQITTAYLSLGYLVVDHCPTMSRLLRDSSVEQIYTDYNFVGCARADQHIAYVVGNNLKGFNLYWEPAHTVCGTYEIAARISIPNNCSFFHFAARLVIRIIPHIQFWKEQIGTCGSCCTTELVFCATLDDVAVDRFLDRFVMPPSITVRRGVRLPPVKPFHPTLWDSAASVLYADAK